MIGGSGHVIRRPGSRPQAAATSGGHKPTAFPMDPIMLPSLDIVIVNWNAGTLLGRCVGSVGTALTGGFALDRLVVIDNASRDGSADALPGQGLPLSVQRNAANRGFAAGCNQGAAGSRADYILFLNPDTRLGPASLAPAVAFLEDPANARAVARRKSKKASAKRSSASGSGTLCGRGAARMSPRFQNKLCPSVSERMKGPV